MRLGFYVTGSATSTYADLVAQVVELDEAGWDSVWLRERHFHRDYGGRNFFSSPLPVAAHLAQLTSKIRLGIGARILPLGLYDPDSGLVLEDQADTAGLSSAFVRGYIYDVAAPVCGQTRVFHLESRS